MPDQGSFFALMKRAIVVLTCLALLACEQNKTPSACRDVLEDVQQLIVVLTDTMETQNAQILVLQRGAGLSTAEWKQVTGPFEAVIGSAGLGWGAGYEVLQTGSEVTKQEGDKRTPAGLFAMGPTFGFEPAAWSGHLDLKAKRPVCVDDLASPRYGEIVSREGGGATTHIADLGEDMANISVYKRGIVVDYPRNRAKKSGSCIFFHIWTGPGEGTAGCIATREGRVAVLQGLSALAKTATVIWPRSGLARLQRCLPDVANALGPFSAK